MSIMDIFRQKPQATASAAGSNSQTQNPTVPSESTALSDGKGPKAIPAAETGDKSPLDGYAKMWETDPNAPKPVDTTVKFNPDPKAIQAAAAKINFSEVIPKDLAEKALKGDPEAFAQAINLASQATYGQSAGASMKLIEGALAKQKEMFETQIIPQIVRQVSSRNAAAADNELLQNPALKPMVDLVSANVLAKNPQASADEIAKVVNSTMKDFSTELAKSYGFEVNLKKEESAETLVMGKKPEQDWSKFLEQK